MKKKIFIIILANLIGTFLYAASTDFATNKKASLKYNEGVKVFNQKDYTKSFEIFDKLVSKYPEHELINFYYGRSAFELKKYEFALTAYDRILISNPTNHRVRLEYARVLFHLESYKEAKKEFGLVLSSPIPLSVRNNVEKFLVMIENKEKNYILNKIAIIGFGWDDNIENTTYLNTTAFGSTNLTNNTNKKDDTNFHAILVGNLIIPNKKNNKITWESTALGYMQEQNKYKDNNIQLVSLSSGVGIVNRKSKNLLSITYDHIWIGGTQTLYIYGITDTIKHIFNPYNQISFNMKFKNKNFSKSKDFDKNSDIEEFSIEYTKIFTNKKDQLKLFTSWISENKKQGTRTDVDKNTNKFQVSYNKELFPSLNLTLSYEKETNKYLRPINVIGLRDDDKDSFSGKLAHNLNKKNIIDLEYKNIDNESNVNTYSYKKQSVNLNYTVIF